MDGAQTGMVGTETGVDVIQPGVDGIQTDVDGNSIEFKADSATLHTALSSWLLAGRSSISNLFCVQKFSGNLSAKTEDGNCLST